MLKALRAEVTSRTGLVFCAVATLVARLLGVPLPGSLAIGVIALAVKGVVGAFEQRHADRSEAELFAPGPPDAGAPDAGAPDAGAPDHWPPDPGRLAPRRRALGARPLDLRPGPQAAARAGREVRAAGPDSADQGPTLDGLLASLRDPSTWRPPADAGSPPPAEAGGPPGDPPAARGPEPGSSFLVGDLLQDETIYAPFPPLGGTFPPFEEPLATGDRASGEVIAEPPPTPATPPLNAWFTPTTPADQHTAPTERRDRPTDQEVGTPAETAATWDWPAEAAGAGQTDRPRPPDGPGWPDGPRQTDGPRPADDRGWVDGPGQTERPWRVDGWAPALAGAFRRAIPAAHTRRQATLDATSAAGRPRARLWDVGPRTAGTRIRTAGTRGYTAGTRGYTAVRAAVGRLLAARRDDGVRRSLLEEAREPWGLAALGLLLAVAVGAGLRPVLAAVAALLAWSIKVMLRSAVRERRRVLPIEHGSPEAWWVARARRALASLPDADTLDSRFTVTRREVDETLAGFRRLAEQATMAARAVDRPDDRRLARQARRLQARRSRVGGEGEVDGLLVRWLGSVQAEREVVARLRALRSQALERLEAAARAVEATVGAVGSPPGRGEAGGHLTDDLRAIRERLTDPGADPSAPGTGPSAPGAGPPAAVVPQRRRRHATGRRRRR